METMLGRRVIRHSGAALPEETRPFAPRVLSDVERFSDIMERDAPFFEHAPPYVPRPFEPVTPREIENLEERLRIREKKITHPGPVVMLGRH